MQPRSHRENAASIWIPNISKPYNLPHRNICNRPIMEQNPKNHGVLAQNHHLPYVKTSVGNTDDPPWRPPPPEQYCGSKKGQGKRRGRAIYLLGRHYSPGNQAPSWGCRSRAPTAPKSVTLRSPKAVAPLLCLPNCEMDATPSWMVATNPVEDAPGGFREDIEPWCALDREGSSFLWATGARLGRSAMQIFFWNPTKHKTHRYKIRENWVSKCKHMNVNENCINLPKWAVETFLTLLNCLFP